MKNESVTTTFHIHEVMNMLAEETSALGLGEILQRMTVAFGPEARFESCSQSGMNPEQAIQFLLMRQKIAEVEPNKFALNTHNTCGHNH